MTEKTVSCTIDGQAVECPAGWTVYEAATAQGIHIPTFCHHEKLEPVGACRMCLVEIEGMVALQTSCTTPVRDKMVVRVHTSPKAVEARRANIEFLLTNHPLDCPVCDKGGECPLQNQALEDGPGRSRYIEEKRHKLKRHPLGSFIVLDQERCVLCWRCIRFLDEWAGEHELDLFGRGADTRLTTFDGRPLSSKWQGNTIDICPVGALTSRVFRFEARAWELANTPSICPLCSVGCNIVLGIKNNELRRITPRENLKVNDAWLCDRGRFGHGFVDHPDRLQTPLIRRDGELRPATWDEALEEIAHRFQEILANGGPGAIGGLGSPRLTSEANYLLQRFMRAVIGTNNVDHLGRVPAGAAMLPSLPEIESGDVILLLGCDPGSEAPLVELWIKKAVLRHGARVVVANPWQIDLGREGDAAASVTWLGYRPGTGVHLVNGLARAILETGQGPQTARGTNLEDVRRWLAPYPPEKVERTCGTPAADLGQAAELLAQAQKPIILYGPNWILGASAGVTAADLWPGRPDTAAESIEVVANLALLLGGARTAYLPGENNAWGVLDMGVVPDRYPGGQPLAERRTRDRLASFWGSKLSPQEGLDFEAMLAAIRQKKLQALWVAGADPAHDSRLAAETLDQVPFLIVQDLVRTRTAELADVVLPAASFAETAGTLVNLTGRLQSLRPARRPPGVAQPDWWIVVELARRMVDPKQQRAWDFASPADVLAEVLKVVPAYRDVSLDGTRLVGEMGWQGPARPGLARRGLTRIEPRLPAGDDEYPLTLMPARLFYDRGSLLRRSEWIQEVVPPPSVTIHPADAQRLGLAGGDRVSVVSAVGRLEMGLAVSEDIVPGTALAPLDLGDVPLSVLFEERWNPPRVRIQPVGAET